MHLLSTLHGGKKLCIPKTSILFQWNAKEVLSICLRDTLYIQPVHVDSNLIFATIPSSTNLERASPRGIGMHVLLFELPNGGRQITFFVYVFGLGVVLVLLRFLTSKLGVPPKELGRGVADLCCLVPP